MRLLKKTGCTVYKLTGEFDSNSLPSPLSERYRTADGPALKAALFLLCEGGCESAGALASALAMSEEVAARALAFWESAGLAVCGGDTPPADKKKAAPRPPKASARAPLSSERIRELSLRDPSIAALYQESETLVGRPLDALESRMLAEICEYDKLPVEVVLTIVAYCAPRAKSNRKIISLAARMATEWSERGISDGEKANEYIRLLEQREKREAQVAELLDLKDKGLSRTAKAHVARWFEEYGYDADFVRAAYMRLQSSGNAVDNPVAYINTILKDWYNSGYTSIKDTMERGGNVQAEASKSRERGENSLTKLALGRRRKEKEESGSGV